jgi:hypothetical protein
VGILSNGAQQRGNEHVTSHDEATNASYRRPRGRTADFADGCYDDGQSGNASYGKEGSGYPPRLSSASVAEVASTRPIELNSVSSALALTAPLGENNALNSTTSGTHAPV